MDAQNVVESCPPEVWSVYMDGWTRGYAEGIEHGRRQAEEEIATLQREAVRVVRYLAEFPARDRDADLAAAEARAARWSR